MCAGNLAESAADSMPKAQCLLSQRRPSAQLLILALTHSLYLGVSVVGPWGLGKPQTLKAQQQKSKVAFSINKFSNQQMSQKTDFKVMWYSDMLDYLTLPPTAQSPYDAS